MGPEAEELRLQLADASASAQRAQPGGLAWVSSPSPCFLEPGQRGEAAAWKAGELVRTGALVRSRAYPPRRMQCLIEAFVHAPRSECQALQAQLAAAFEGGGAGLADGERLPLAWMFGMVAGCEPFGGQPCRFWRHANS